MRAARAVGIDVTTLYRWIREGKVNPPKPTLRNGLGVRLWSNADIERLKKIKSESGWRGRGRKKKKKA